MKFEWDERKNQSNIAKHGFDFGDAFGIFNLPIVVEFDEREDYSEDRYIGIRLLNSQVVVVVYTEPDDEDFEVERFVSIKAVNLKLLMTLAIVAEPAPLQANEDGVILVGKTRVTLDTVVAVFNQSATAEESVAEFS
jgi:hypothetical protein